MSITSFVKLRFLLRKQRVHIRILGKGGIPVKMMKLKRRKILLLGPLLVAAAIWAVTSFVWTVQVTGSEMLEGAVRTHLKSMGIEAVLPKNAVDIEKISKSLLLSNPAIAWAQGAHRRG